MIDKAYEAYCHTLRYWGIILFSYTLLISEDTWCEAWFANKSTDLTSEDRKVIWEGTEVPRKVQMHYTKYKLIMHYKIEDVYGAMSWFLAFWDSDKIGLFMKYTKARYFIVFTYVFGI